MYKDFIDACHKAGMAVIFDVVYNHATGSMPFAKLYWNSANNKTAPNNPYFNVDAPHPYSVFHDFNHESPLVRKFVKRNLQFLLNEYHIDGFRFDLTKGFTQAASTESSASNYDKSRIEILKDYHAAIKEVKPEAYVILEHFCDSKEEKELAEDGMHLWRNMNNAYCQTAMGWNDDSAFDGLYESIPAWIGFMESHDEERAAYKQTQWGDEALKTDLTTRMRQLEVNASFFFTVPGPKMIWQFGEMGYDVSIEENGRTGKKPLHWEYLENKDRKALHDSYSRLIKLRNDNPELFTSTSQFSWEVGTSNWGQGRFITLSSTTKHMLVAGNFSKTDGAYTVTFPVTGKWYDYLTGDEVEVKDATQKMEIPAHSYRILTTFPCLN
jgi:1,4-alpha-glucan branching enzyme